MKFFVRLGHGRATLLTFAAFLGASITSRLVCLVTIFVPSFCRGRRSYLSQRQTFYRSIIYVWGTFIVKALKHNRERVFAPYARAHNRTVSLPISLLPWEWAI